VQFFSLYRIFEFCADSGVRTVLQLVSIF
jgi:hypothetical protein